VTSDTDATGHPTVGYGHLCTQSKCAEVKYKIPLSQADGKKLLADDIKVRHFDSNHLIRTDYAHTTQKYEKCVTSMAKSKAKLNANQYGAVVSFTFNLGCGAAEGSQMMKRLNNGENPNTVIANEFPKWVHGNGAVLPGLVRRRNAEIALAKKATSTAALPPKC
jgi:GH24 family phage-related lysozyme (muramidase)